jgi:hypothetical protein
LIRVFGSELRVGDTIETWWAPNRDTITRLVPYRGAHAYMREAGWQIAYFAQHRGGMMINPTASFELLARPGGVTTMVTIDAGFAQGDPISKI